MTVSCPGRKEGYPKKCDNTAVHWAVVTEERLRLSERKHDRRDSHSPPSTEEIEKVRGEGWVDVVGVIDLSPSSPETSEFDSNKQIESLSSPDMSPVRGEREGWEGEPSLEGGQAGPSPRKEWRLCRR